MRIALEQIFKNLALFFIDRDFRSFIFLAFRIGGKKRYQEQSIKINGIKMSIPDNLSFLWQYHEIFVQKSYNFKPLCDSPIIFDCGANVGTSVIFFKKYFPKSVITAYEPDPSIFLYLKQNVAANKCDNVELVNAAVWNEKTTLLFHSEGADGGNITADKSSINQIEVQALVLKDEIAKQERVDLLKIDIEGAEYQVLEHCQSVLRKVENIFLECHSFSSDTQKIQDILAILNKSGFRYFILNESRRKQPFVNTSLEKPMDMQVNIFGYRI